jgi:hypothetical protein
MRKFKKRFKDLQDIAIQETFKVTNTSHCSDQKIPLTEQNNSIVENIGQD